MASAIHNFFIEQGSSFEITFEYLDTNGNPIPISQLDCVRLKLKTNTNEYSIWRDGILSDNASLLTFKQDSTLSTNQIKWKIPSYITKKYNFDNAIYSLDIVKGGSSPEIDVIKLATGQISIIRDTFLSECEEESNTLKTCKDCTTISAQDSISQPDPNNIQPTPAPSSAIVDPTITPTPTPSSAPTVIIQEENLCDYLCKGLDIFAELYTGSGINILDATISGASGLPSLSSGTLSISNSGLAANIELYIDSLIHENPSDLSLILQPPTGNSILLSYRNKIANYSRSTETNTKFAFSNKALPGIYLNNKPSGNDLYVNVLNNSVVALPSPFDNATYSYSFDHLLGGSVSGNWTLSCIDHDPRGTGYIKNWNLIVTYIPPTEYDENV